MLPDFVVFKTPPVCSGAVKYMVPFLSVLNIRKPSKKTKMLWNFLECMFQFSENKGDVTLGAFLLLAARELKKILLSYSSTTRALLLFLLIKLLVCFYGFFVFILDHSSWFGCSQHSCWRKPSVQSFWFWTCPWRKWWHLCSLITGSI